MKRITRAVFCSVWCVLAFACGGDSDAPADGASERDACDAVAVCVLGAGDAERDSFADECVTEGVFADATPACLACLVDLSCANLEGAFEGDADAQAMCPSCE